MRRLLAGALILTLASCVTPSTSDNITAVVDGVKTACGFQPELAAVSLLLGAGNLPASIISAICTAANRRSAIRGRTTSRVAFKVQGVTVYGRYVR